MPREINTLVKRPLHTETRRGSLNCAGVPRLPGFVAGPAYTEGVSGC
jgi:hypothetical protein